MKFLLKQDSRDLHAHEVFGAAVNLLTEANYDDVHIPQKIQPIGDVKCTCFACSYVAQNKDKVEYDIDELFSRVPHNIYGASPYDVLGEVIKNGLTIKAMGQRVKPFSSYFRADTGRFDPFDNLRSNMQIARTPALIWTNWYKEWIGLAPNSLMPLGKKEVSGHMYAGLGWIEGENVIIEWWGGYTLKMPRETFNDAVKKWGCGAAILSTFEIDAIRSRTFLEWIKDSLINILLLYKQLLKKEVESPAVDVYKEVKDSLIKDSTTIVNQSKINLQPIVNKYDWSTPASVRHSLRVICDESHLDVSEKNIICAVIQEESGFNPKAIGKRNSDGTQDFGLCQYNNGKDKKGRPFWIGEGATFKDVDEVLNNPEKNVRVMISTFKEGHIDYWSAYKDGSYRKYL